MATKEDSAAVVALKSLVDRVQMYRDLIDKKCGKVEELKEEMALARDETEKKDIFTTIKALEYDMTEDVNMLRGLENDTQAIKTSLDGMEENTEREEVKEEGSKAMYTEEDMRRLLKQQEDEKRLTGMESRMDRLITALAATRTRSSSPPAPPPTDRKRTLGMMPNFTTGVSDFIIHVEGFRDYCQLNDIVAADKVKRLFLISLDQTARMRCGGLEPDKAPCLAMTADAYINRIKEMFVPRATLLIVQQAFHELKQKPNELAVDYLMAKFAKFKRGWSDPAAPFSFYYEAATAGFYDEGLRNEIYRVVIECSNSDDRTELNAAFQRYVEHVQQAVAYVRRTGGHHNPDNRGLGVSGQASKPAGRGHMTIAEMGDPTGEEEEGNFLTGDEEEIEELDEQQIAFVEAMEDPRLTHLVEEDAQCVAEGEAKLCFLCRSPSHLARACGMRMRNLSGTMGRMGFSHRGAMRGAGGGGGRGWVRRGQRGAGGWGKGSPRGRAAPLSGFPARLPPGPTMRPLTSAQAGAHRPNF